MKNNHSTNNKTRLMPGISGLVLATLIASHCGVTSYGQITNQPVDSNTAHEASADVSPARLKMYEAMINVQDKRHAEAIPKLEWVIATDPTLLQAWATLGWAYWAMGREKDAAELWQRLADIAPDEPLGYNLLAQVATRDGNLARAEELYEKSLLLNPDQYEIRLSRARVLLWNGKSERALKELRQLLKEDPDRLDVEIDMAWAMYANEEYEEVLEVWNHINDAVPDRPDFLLARANVLLLIGSLAEAEFDARHLLEVDPDNRGAVNLLATLAMRARRPEEAVEALRKVMQLTKQDASQARVAFEIASYMKRMYDTDKTVFTLAQCLQAAREAYELDSENVPINLFYGELLVAAKEYDHAAKIFQSVIDRFNPFNIRAHTGLLETYFGRMQLDEAEKKLTENLRLFNPNYPFRHLYWARLHFARGNYAATMEALDRLEREGAQGAIFVLLYHGLSPSEWSDMPSARQFREHLMVLRRAGFKFITPSKFADYFAKHKTPPPPAEERPLLYRALQSLRYAWSGKKSEATPTLEDFSPDRTVCVTMDDALRNSLRYGTVTAEELQVPLTMFVPVGSILVRDMYSASFPEIMQYMETGQWEIQSHLWDAGYTVQTNEHGQLVNPLPNLTWLPEKNRRESLREYHARLRHEFRDSRRVLARELRLDESAITAVAYPIGDIGQETTCNIDVFNVPEIILNEAEISYRQGFIQDNFGYAMATDNPMLYKRYEPPRNATGRDVLREALRQHPVFTARRMRAEIAALNGQLHLAMQVVDTLKRDGYPEEDLAELNDFVKQHLARLTPVPAAIDNISVTKESWLEPKHPYLAAEAASTKANVMIDEWRAGASAGLNLTPRLIFEVRAGLGAIKQTVRSNTWIEVEQTTRSYSQSDVRIISNEGDTYQREERTTYNTVMVQTNVITEHKFKADETLVGGGLRYIHAHGALTLMDMNYRVFEGDHIGDEGALAFAAEHQWRPVPAIDMSARYQHDLVPSAREVLAYNGVALRGIWRIHDWWHANGLAAFSQYDDDNSHLHANIENLWRISHNHNIWFGLHDSVNTVDKDNDLYWTPYWDQRHYFILRLGHSYPNYFGMVRLHLGLQKDKARPDILEKYNTAKTRGEAEGWYPGENPQQGWASLLGIGTSLTRRWDSGWELTGEFTVNAIRDYTEHTLSGKLMYRF